MSPIIGYGLCRNRTQSRENWRPSSRRVLRRGHPRMTLGRAQDTAGRSCWPSLRNLLKTLRWNRCSFRAERRSCQMIQRQGRRCSFVPQHDRPKTSCTRAERRISQICAQNGGKKKSAWDSAVLENGRRYGQRAGQPLPRKLQTLIWSCRPE